MRLTRAESPRGLRRIFQFFPLRSCASASRIASSIQAALWPETFVSESSLTNAVAQAAIGDGADGDLVALGPVTLSF
jgi:hypothetical protein